jgi:hypothetical protein
MKALEKKIEEYSHLGLRHSIFKNVLNSIELDIFRYLFRNGIILSTSEVDAVDLKSDSKEEQIVAEKFVELVHFLIKIFPILYLLNSKKYYHMKFFCYKFY